MIQQCGVTAMGQIIHRVLVVTFGRGAFVFAPVIHSPFALVRVIEKKILADAIGKFTGRKQEFPGAVDAVQRKRGGHFAGDELNEGVHIDILHE
jgi:hypothetical protein